MRGEKTRHRRSFRVRGSLCKGVGMNMDAAGEAERRWRTREVGLECVSVIVREAGARRRGEN